MDDITLKNLKLDATILDKIKYTERGVVTADLIASMIGMRVIIGKAVISTDEETVAGTEFTAQDLWAYNYTTTTALAGMAFMAFVPPAPALKTPSAGYTFRWKDRVTKRWREEDIHSDVIEVSENYVVKLVGSATCGLSFWDTILSTD